jgi:eukaryotic-like serine/threonine-protein kinase
VGVPHPQTGVRNRVRSPAQGLPVTGRAARRAVHAVARFWLWATARVIVGARTARFGRFEIVSRLGFGGMGEVFRARARGAGEPDVALKLIRPEHSDNPRFQQMFFSEARVGASLFHPNLVRTLEHGDVDGVLYLVTELVEGVSLAALERAGPLPLDAALYVALELLAALDHAHRLGLVHRDVSPSNVLVSDAGEVKLADFGVAKARGSKLTQNGEVKGKDGYMAPEQSDGAAVDGRADLFSLAVLLHELLTGQKPRFGEPLDVDEPLAAVLVRALEPDPAARFGNARALEAALRGCGAPDEAARVQLGRQVRAARQPDRPLAAIERMLMAFDEPSQPSALIYAPDPSTNQLWLLQPETPPISQPITTELRVPAPLHVLPTDPLPLPLPAATVIDEPATMASSPRRAARFAAATALVLAGACSVILGMSGGTPTRDAASLTLEPELALAPPPARQPPVEATAVPVAPAPRISDQRPALRVPPPIVDPLSPRLSVEPKREARPAPRGVGWLTLDSEPWAVVYLDKRRIGTTPFLHVALPAGRNELSLDVQDKGHRIKKTVDILKGGHKRLALELVASP